MAQPTDTLPPPTALPPSIIRSASLSPARPMPSPRFDVDEHHSFMASKPKPEHPFQLATGSSSPALLSPSPAPPTSSILLNKPQPQHTPGSATPGSPQPEQHEAIAGLALLRVAAASPAEGSAVPSTTSSPPPLDQPSTQQPPSSGPVSYFAEQQQQAAESMGRPSRSPSPHCHFAPLPNVESSSSSRPGTRRNSAAQGASRVKPFVARGEQQSDDSPFSHSNSGDLDSSTLASTLSSLSLLRRDNSTTSNTGTGSPRAPRSRHASSRSSRSTSPSPSRRPALGPTHSSTSSRSHSPAMSRRASTDAMSLHYIEGSKVGAEGGAGGASGSRERERGVSVTAGDKERELEFERQRMREQQGWKEEREAALAGSRPTSTEPRASEGDRTASPARRPIFVEPSKEERIKPVRRRSNEEVVEIEPGEEKAEEELEDLEEEEEEHEGGTEEDDEEEEDDDEDDEEDDDDEGEERSREEDDEEEEELEPRATSRGAAVEVVHWHRSASPERERE